MMRGESTECSLETAREVRKAWELFVTGQDENLESVRSEIRASWQRSRQAGVDPSIPCVPLVLAPEKLYRRCRQRSFLLKAGREVIALLSRTLSAETFLIGILDDEGYLLYSYFPPHSSDKQEDLNAFPGAGIQENTVGTTSSSIALSLNRTFQVYWYEHYTELMHGWAACTAPIHNSCGDILGALLISGYRQVAHSYALDLVTATAGFIEERIKHFEQLGHLKVLQEFNRRQLKFPDIPLLAFCPQGRVLALSPSIAKVMIEQPPERLIGQHIQYSRDFRFKSLSFSSTDIRPEPYEVSLFLPGREKVCSARVFPIFLEEQQVGSVVIADNFNHSTPRKPPTPSWKATYTFRDLVGDSPLFSRALHLAQKAAEYDWPVLLVGESGTGKELFAQAIHQASRRAPGPFVAVNCGTIPKDLATSELFGYEEGAFSGALRGGQQGKFELAHCGTLFLDEVADIPPEIQVSLLRVLEERKVTPLGSKRPREIDVRIIAAMNITPQEAVAQGTFRFDLYHRLNVFSIFLPPLRERREDLFALVRFLLDREGFVDTTVSPEAMEIFQTYSWPGNIRELRNVLLKAAVLSSNRIITREQLPSEFLTRRPLGPSPYTPSARLDRSQIKQALQKCKGSVPDAARYLGIHRATLYRKLRQHGLQQETQAKPETAREQSHIGGLPSRLKGRKDSNQQSNNLSPEVGNLSILVIRALLSCLRTSVSSISNPSSINSEQKCWSIKTAEITKTAQRITQEEDELSMDPSWISSKRVGRILARLGLKKAPDTSKRAWQVGPEEIKPLEGVLEGLGRLR